MKRALSLGLFVCFITSVAHANLLDELYQQARLYDAQYQGSRADYMAGLQAKAQLRAGMLPRISASAAATRAEDEITKSVIPQQVGSSSSTSFTAALRLTQPLFDWGVYARARQMDEFVDRAEAGLVVAEQDLIMRTVNAYFNWLAAEDNLRFAKAEQQAIEQQLRQAQSRYDVGLSAITDVQEVKARFDASRAQEISAASRLRSAAEAVFVITGQRPETPVPLQESFQTSKPEPATPESWVDNALANNPGLQQVMLTSRIAREQVSEEKSAYFPQLNLVAESTYTDLSDTPQGLESEGNSIGLQLQVPLFAGGGNHARVQERRYRYEKAEADVLLRQRETAQLARDNYDGVVTGQIQVEAYGQAVKSSRVALDAIQAGFNVGSRTAVDVLDAQGNLYRAERDLSRARYDYLLSVLRLQQAVGQLSSDDLSAVDALLISSR